jgi:hypothetical protein
LCYALCCVMRCVVLCVVLCYALCCVMCCVMRCVCIVLFVLCCLYCFVCIVLFVLFCLYCFVCIVLFVLCCLYCVVHEVSSWSVDVVVNLKAGNTSKDNVIKIICLYVVWFHNPWVQCNIKSTFARCRGGFHTCMGEYLCRTYSLKISSLLKGHLSRYEFLLRVLLPLNVKGNRNGYFAPSIMSY